MTRILKQGETATIRFVESLIKTSDGSRLTTGATARVCIDGTWGDGAGTLSVDETDQWKYTLHSSEAAGRNIEIAIDHADAVGPIGGMFTLLSPDAYNHVVLGARFNNEGGYIRFVDDAGSDSNDGFTRSTPLLTLGQANTSSADRDTVRLMAGDYSITGLAAKGIHIIGDRVTTTEITITGTSLSVNSGGSIENLTVNGQIILVERYNVTMRNLLIVGSDSAIELDACPGTIIENVIATASGSASWALEVVGDSSALLGSEQYTSCVIVNSFFRGELHGAYLDDRCLVAARDSRFEAIHAGTPTFNVGAIGVDSHNTTPVVLNLHNCDLRAVASNASFTQTTAGVTSYGPNTGTNTGSVKLYMVGGSIQSTNAGSAPEKHVDLEHATASEAVLVGVLHDPTLNAGNVRVVDKDVADAVADTNELQQDWANGGRLDVILDARASQTTADAILEDTGTTGVVSVVGNVGGNVVGSVGSLAAQAKADVNAEADAALADYDGPTNAEMVARTLVAANYATATALQTVDDNVDAILVDTGTTIPGILGTPEVTIADDIAGIEAGSGASAEDVWTYAGDRLLTAGTNIVLAKGTGITGFNDLSAAQVNAEADAALSDAGVTTTRTGYLDNLNIGGVVASASTMATVASKTEQLDFTGTGGALKSESTNMRGTDNALPAASYTAPLTAQQTRDAMKLAPSGGAAANNSIDDKIDNVEGGGGGGEPASFDNTDIVEAFVTKLGTRHDGVLVAYPTLEMVQGEVLPFWIDCDAVCGGRNLRNVTEAVASDSDLEIVSAGMNNRKAVIWVDTSDAAPGEYVVQCKVHPWQGKASIAQQPISITAPLVSGGGS